MIFDAPLQKMHPNIDSFTHLTSDKSLPKSAKPALSDEILKVI